MKLNNIYENLNFDEMVKFFNQRTNQHIDRVKNFLSKCANGKYKKYGSELFDRGNNHDQSKFRKPEFIPYVYLTWEYKSKNDGNGPLDFSNELRNQINEVTFLHCKNNKHHPEYWDNNIKENPINKNDRDKPSGIIVDGSSMDELSIIEMVCDWSAMSEEYSEPGPYKWADDNIGKRWKFSPDQKDKIYEIIKYLW